MYRLNEHQSLLIGQLQKLTESHIAPHAADVDEKAQFPRESIQALAEAGWLGLAVPEEYGGMGQNMRLASAALERISYHCPSTAMVFKMHLCACASYLLNRRTEPELLRDVARGRHLSTLAWSEKGSRGHFWAPVSQAREQDGQVVLEAEKSWVTSAGQADGYVVSTRVPGAAGPTETALYLVLSSDPGIKVSGSWNGLGLRGNASAPMRLEQCVIPRSRALCDPGGGFSRMLEILPWFNLGSAAIAIGIAEAAVAATTAHLTSSRLEHMNSRLADLPTLRARLAQMRIETDRARAHLVCALDAVESGRPESTLLVLETKAAAAESVIRVTDLAMQACGGAAFSKHLRIERCFRDARAGAVMAPTSDVLQEFIGRALCGMNLF